MSTGPARATFYYDLGSPYAYLAAERVTRLLPEPPRWQPVLLGALMKRSGTTSWALGASRSAGIAEVERRAAAYGLPPVAWPEPWPGNYLFAMRVAAYAQQSARAEAFALAAFRAAFVDGRDLTEPANVLRAAAACRLDCNDARNAAESAAMKQALREATERAAEVGVHGVPTVVIDRILFFGDDRLEEAAACMRGYPR